MTLPIMEHQDGLSTRTSPKMLFLKCRQATAFPLSDPQPLDISVMVSYWSMSFQIFTLLILSMKAWDEEKPPPAKKLK